VGEKTITAVADFQKTVGLKASGFPNEITLYYLQNLNLRSLNIGRELQQINEKSKSNFQQNTINKKPIISLANNSTTTDLE
jgi:peptidoglycan hydrolase-like protein with peptidoglycan-binding domain